jgi:hypothetical protein
LSKDDIPPQIHPSTSAVGSSVIWTAGIAFGGGPTDTLVVFKEPGSNGSVPLDVVVSVSDGNDPNDLLRISRIARKTRE